MDKKFINEFLGGPYIYRYRKPNKNTLAEIEDGYLYFSSRENLNDPFDSNPFYVQLTEDPEALKSFYFLLSQSFPNQNSKEKFISTYTPEIIREFINSQIYPFIHQFGVVCFSFKMDNFALWANYADNNKGLCLQFNVKKDLDLFSDLRPVKYHLELPLINFNPLPNFNNLTEIFFNKTKDWSYEEELRLLKTHTAKYFFNPSSLEKIIVGYKAEKNS